MASAPCSTGEPARLRCAFPLGFVVAVLVVASAPAAHASVWNTNQVFLNGYSGSAILANDNVQPSYTGCVSPGQQVHIVYGIQDPVGDPNQIALTVTLPPAFHPTLTRWANLPGGIGSSSGTTVPNASTFSLPAFALSGQSDKVLVVVDGYFTTKGAYSAAFVPVRGGTSEPTSLTMSACSSSLPVDISITKAVKPQGSGAFGSTATVAFGIGSAVTYKLTVKNLSAPASDQSTDVYLGKLLLVQDQFSTPNSLTSNDVRIAATLQNFQCTAVLNADCPTMPTGSIALPPLPRGSSVWIPGGFTYPALSLGFLPAQGSFDITFDAVITTPDLCSPLQNNQLLNVGYFTYSDGINSLSDQLASNNTSPPVTVSLTGLPPTGCQQPIPGIQITKTLISSGTGAWGQTFTYQITITNTSTQTLTGLGLNDYVIGAGTPPFTANFSGAVTCTPACIPPLPVSAAPLVGTWYYAYLFSANFAPLPPGGVQTVQYPVQYVAPPCAESTASGAITNWASLTGAATGNAWVTTAMPPLPLCQLQVTKTQPIGPTSFASYPVTLGYQVTFANTSPTQTLTVRTLIDTIALDSSAYGDVPISYSYSCTPAGVTGVSPLTKSVPSALAQYNTPLWAGTKLIDFSSAAGAVFAPLGTLTCNLSVTLNQPSTTDSKCQGAGTPQLRNSAFMDLEYPYNTNLTQPVFYQQVTTPLPHCLSIIVGKTAPSQVYAGGPVTFTLTVTNVGNDPTPNGINLVDAVPASFGPPFGWSVVSGPGGSGSFAGNTLTVSLNPIPGGGTTTISLNATAPTALGAYCNQVQATFNPFPPLTYFEGNQAQLTTASACIQVIPAPKPTLIKSFHPQTINPGQTVQVAFVLTNAAGAGAQSGLSFADVLPNPPFTSGTLGVNTCGGTVTVNGNIVSLQNGSLPVGPSSCLVMVQMNTDPRMCGLYHNGPKNIHESNGVDYQHLDAELNVKCPDPPPKPTLTKRFVPSTITMGQPLNVVFTLTNPVGGAPQSGLNFIDSLPSPPFTTGTLGPNTCGGTPVVNGNVVSLQNGSLPLGPSSCTVVFQMATDPTKCGVYKNDSKNIHEAGNVNYQSLDAELNVKCVDPPPKPTLKKQFVPSVIAMGQPVNVVFVLTNPGGAVAQSGLSFTDSLPNPPFTTGTVFSNSCAGVPAVNGSNVSLQNGSLPPGPSSCTVVFQMATDPKKCGVYHNNAKNFQESKGVNYESVDAEVTVKCVDPPPKPTLQKQFVPSVVNLGKPVHVVFTLTNPAGAGPQSGFSFVDSLPNPPLTSGTVFSNTCGGTPAVNGSVVSLLNGSLPAGPSSCKVEFAMAPVHKCGTFNNTKDNLHGGFGLDTSAFSATLLVNCE